MPSLSTSEYETEAEALALVRRTVQRYGREEAISWALTRDEGDEDDDDAGEAVEGEDLVERALAVRA